MCENCDIKMWESAWAHVEGTGVLQRFLYGTNTLKFRRFAQDLELEDG